MGTGIVYMATYGGMKVGLRHTMKHSEVSGRSLKEYSSGGSAQRYAKSRLYGLYGKS